MEQALKIIEPSHFAEAQTQPITHWAGAAGTRSPLFQPADNAFFKLENLGAGGSHKSRAARWMIRRAIERGELTPFSGQTIIEKTGGNLGIGLAVEAARWGFGLDLAVGLSFSPLKRQMLAFFGASLVGLDMLREGAQPVDVIDWHLKHARRLNKRYYYVNQFENRANVDAHFLETGPELIGQLAIATTIGARRIVLVGGIGSGASLSGVGHALKDAFRNVEVIGVQPKGCDILANQFVDHDLQGIAVGINPETFDESIVDRFIWCSESAAHEARKAWAQQFGIFPGNTSGANIWTVNTLQQTPGYEDAIFVSFIYDNGEAYVQASH